MRILHVIPSLSVHRGGPSTALMSLAAEQQRRGHAVDIATTDDDGPGRARMAPGQVRCECAFSVRFFPRQTSFYSVSVPLARWLRRHVADYDVVHAHALFSFAPAMAALAARRRGVPYVIRPLGTLNRWGMEHRRPLLKRLSFHLIEKPLLDRAAAIQYTSPLEREHAERLAIRAPCAVIPLGIALPPAARPEEVCTFRRAHEIPPDSPVVLFMSRFDPKKGLDLLLDAFEIVARQDPDVVLVLAGGDREDLRSPDRRSVPLQCMVDRVRVVGFLEGVQKAAALASADVLVLPSRSENFGLAAVEAMAAGLPVVVSTEVGVAGDVEDLGAGLVVPLEASEVADALNRLLGDPNMRSRCSEGARDAARRFSLEGVVDRLDELYASIRRPC